MVMLVYMIVQRFYTIRCRFCLQGRLDAVKLGSQASNAASCLCRLAAHCTGALMEAGMRLHYDDILMSQLCRALWLLLDSDAGLSFGCCMYYKKQKGNTTSDTKRHIASLW